MVFLQRTAGNRAVDESIRRALHTSGQPLNTSTRTLMESRFGRDLSQVRVHTNPDAATSASAIQAQAYTVDQDMVFADGQFSPDTTEGRTLLAHELAHTIQQRDGTGATPSNDPHGAHETTARAAAQNVASGQPAHTAMPAAGVGLSMTPADDERNKAVAEAVAVATRPTPANDADEEEAAPAKPVPGPRTVTLDPLYRTPRFEASLWSDRDIADPMKRVRRDRAAKPEEVKRRKSRRRHTRQFFNKISDDRLQEAYESRLQRYLDEGMEDNKYWDLETIEQIVQERAPDAPWIDQTRQEVLARWQIKRRDEKRRESLPTLPEDQRMALAEMDRRTAKWTDEEKTLARDLLWEWLERHNEGQARGWIDQQILGSLVDHYEGWLRSVDQAIQEEARRRPKPVGFGEHLKRGLENAWGDQSEPWFEHPWQHGHFERHDFDAWLRVTTRSGDERPLDMVFYSVQEYRMRTNPEMQLKKLQAMGLVGLGMGVVGLAARLPSLSRGPGVPPAAEPPGSPNRPRPGMLGRMVRNTYLAAKLTLDDVVPELSDIGAGRPVAGAVQPKAPTSISAPKGPAVSTSGPVSASPDVPATAPSRPSSAPVAAAPRSQIPGVPAAIDADVEAALAEGAQVQVGSLNQTGRVRTTGSGQQLRTLGEVPLTDAQRDAATIVHGQTMTADHQDAWQNATNAREQAELAQVNFLWNLGTNASQQQARDLARGIFDRHRGRYWAAVRANAALRAVFEAAGMRFAGGNTTAPLYDLPDGTTIRLTLEHSTRLADDPTRALSGSNLQWVLGDENSVNLEVHP